MEFQDRPIECIDCKNEFVFTAGEQEFYERKGFKEVPKRCKPCRDARKTRRMDRDSGPSPREEYGNRQMGQASQTQDDRGNRRPRELFDAVCAACGAPARVPFRPANGRPVYCKDCYASRQGQGSGYGGGGY